MSQVKELCRPWETETSPRCGNCRGYDHAQDTEGNCKTHRGRVRAIALAFPNGDARENPKCFAWKPDREHILLRAGLKGAFE